MYNFIKKVMFSALIIGSMVCTTIRPAMMMMPSVAPIRAVQLGFFTVGGILMTYGFFQKRQHDSQTHSSHFENPNHFDDPSGKHGKYVPFGVKYAYSLENNVIKPAFRGGTCLGIAGILGEVRKHQEKKKQTAIDLETTKA